MYDFERQGDLMADEMDSEAPLSAYAEGSFEGGELEGQTFEDLFNDQEVGGDGFADWEAPLSGTDGFEPFGDEEDQFLGGLWKAAKKAASVVAPIAKKFAPQIGTLIGGALGGPAGAALGGKLGGLAQNLEGEGEGDTEAELNAPSNFAAVDEALSESMAATATRVPPSIAQSMGSAITVTLASREPLAVKAVVPVLAKASGDIARTLAGMNDPRARTLVRVIPTIQKRTIATLSAKARAGKPITPRTAVRVMRRQANRVLGNPQAVTRALATNVQKKRTLDRAAIARAERFA